MDIWRKSQTFSDACIADLQGKIAGGDDRRTNGKIPLTPITLHPLHTLFVPTTALTRSPAALTSSARLYRRIASTAHASHYRLREPSGRPATPNDPRIWLLLGLARGALLDLVIGIEIVIRLPNRPVGCWVGLAAEKEGQDLVAQASTRKTGQRLEELGANAGTNVCQAGVGSEPWR